MASIRRMILSAATAGAALTAGVALAVGPGMTAAHAETKDTPKSTVRIVEGHAWKKLQEDDRGYRVAAVRCFLDYYDYFQGCDPTAEDGNLFTPELTEAVKKYQKAKHQPENGTVTAETWSELRNDVSLVKEGDKRKDVVKGVQYALNVLGKEGLKVDGVYGKGTKEAVERLQERNGFEDGVDGIVGPVTFRAMYAQNAK